MFRVPTSCVELFQAAGWFPGRRRACRVEGFDSDYKEQGIRLLEEFGGLRVGQCGPGRDRATSDIEFATQATPASLYSVQQVNERLFPIGEAHHGHGELFVDPQGRVFMYGVPDGSFQLVGESFADAVERLLLGLNLPAS